MSDHNNLEETSTSAAVQDNVKGIVNFRDVGESVGKRYMREGMMFRSATLEDVEEGDLRSLLDRFKFKTIIDLSE